MTLTRRQFHLTTLSSALGLASLATLPARAATAEVQIKGMAFQPASLSVKKGDTVTFTNEDGVPHTSTADGGGWDTGRLTKGKSASVKFAKAGTFTYHCAVHPSMKGSITVA